MVRQTDARVATVTDRGKEIAGEVRDKAGELVHSARGGAGNLQATLADRLEAGAQAIRNRAGRSTEVEPTFIDSYGAGETSRAVQAGTAVADGMDRAAMWLRETDLTDFGALLRRELRLRPGRTALMALGIGILIGRASRR